MLFPLVKVPLLISASYLHHQGFTAPNPTPDETEEASYAKAEGGHIRNAVRYWNPVLLKTISWTTSICESVLIITEYPTLPMSTQTLSFLTSFVGISTSSISRIQITPDFVAGWLLIAGGTLLRLSTFRTMGRFFTFELAVKKDHQLVTTGPYAIVRHPSYTACIILFAGSALITLGRGSWLTECTTIWSSVFGRVGAGLLIAWWVWATKVLVGRTTSEDAVLKKEFGSQWETWAKNTPYKLFPGIY